MIGLLPKVMPKLFKTFLGVLSVTFFLGTVHGKTVHCISRSFMQRELKASDVSTDAVCSYGQEYN